MSREKHRLSARAVTALKEPGRHADGGGLYLAIDPNGRRRWIYRYRWGTKVRDLGLGACPPVGLSDARELAEEARRLVAMGKDPIAERRRAEAEAVKPVTFAQAAEELLASFDGSWRNPKHRAQWRMTLTDYCKPIRSKPVSDITTADVLGILKPMWQKKPETASRLRGRIERVMGLAKVRGWRKAENPATWRNNLDQLLPSPRKLSRGHHKALPYSEVPGLIEKLRENGSHSALALEFTILTAARTGETIAARWEEFDLAEKVWNVPAERMKARKPHRVPLSPRAVEIIQTLSEARKCDFVFWGVNRRKQYGPMSQMSLAMVLRRLEIPATVHGFRSSFKDWASETTPFPNEVSEAALAHVVSNQVEAAYRRGDLFQKRRALMEAWSAFLDRLPVDNVISLDSVRASGTAHEQ